MTYSSLLDELRIDLSDINTDPVINPESFDLARYYNDIYKRMHSARFAEYVKRLADQAELHSLHEYAEAAGKAIAAGTTPTASLPTVTPNLQYATNAATHAQCTLVDSTTCSQVVARQIHHFIWDFIWGSAQTRAFSFLVTFCIVSVLHPDVRWPAWEDEVNTKRWRCTFYVFDDGRYRSQVLRTALLVYLVVYPVTYFLVPTVLLQSTCFLSLAKLWSLWKWWAFGWLVLRAVQMTFSAVYLTVSTLWSIFSSERGRMFESIWKKRYLACLVLVVVLAWYPNRHGPNGLTHVCGTHPKDYDGGGR
ncbi:hypothetical protein QBC41DRAFT_374408 [Cercophora samala]|uniref:Uncharacterized protein n=1 Tax=Cercophora samala TaxID=330535 RepID=A0AA40DAE1_9PEZI|nr:hypothetical protein QBC41DRAFT_374408 [Cercophora samala]